MEAGLGIIRRAAASVAMSELGIWEAWPGSDTGDSDGVRTWARSAVGSYYHPAGTCRIGSATDRGAVVNPQLRIHGITGLRVADASVMPVIPNARCTRPCARSQRRPPTSSPHLPDARRTPVYD